MYCIYTMIFFMEEKFDDINRILDSALKPESLKELFESKLLALDISPTTVLDILGISYRTLKGVLEGTQKTFDHTNLIKIANLLQVPREHVVKLYFDALDANFPTIVQTTPEKIKFIKENFDLAILKKDGFIESITDFNHIENRIIARLGLRSIFEYRKPAMDIAFSSGIFQTKNALTRFFWIAAAKACFEEIDNPYDYDRQALLDFFPQIRWHSTDVEHGLLNVIKKLYRCGVSVIYQPPLHTLQLRGATFSVNDKPCIVLTNYVGFYGTLWFALIHELLHVIFDWGEIRENKYHLSDDSNEDISVKEKEEETNKYAREYLFSIEKTNKIKPFLNNANYVKEFALQNHIHPSIIYAFNARDIGHKDRMAWARARRNDAKISDCITPIDLPWGDSNPVDTIFKRRKLEIYN
jgi:HTH-type transcriptional regulator/antitoxin HigA